MNAEDLCFESACSLHERITSKEVSAREVLDAFLARIDVVNPKLNAYTYLDAEGARKRAEELDRSILKSGPSGPLHGIPVSVKDLTPTRGIRTTFGSRMYYDHIPDEDALVVRRLKKAGAV